MLILERMGWLLLAITNLLFGLAKLIYPNSLDDTAIGILLLVCCWVAYNEYLDTWEDEA